MEELTEKELKEIKKELGIIESVAMLKWPLFASLLRKCRIIASTDIEIAAVTIKNELLVNPEYLKKADDTDKVFTYCHEAGHIGFFHPQRAKGKNAKLANISMDCVVNTILFAHGFDKNRFPEDVTAEKVAAPLKRDEKEVAKMSFEELYYLLEKQYKDKEPPFKIKRNDISTKEGNAEKGQGQEQKQEQKGNTQKTGSQSKQENNQQKPNGKVIQEGDPEAYKPDITQEELEKYWKDALIKAAMQAKMAGQLPADAELIIKDLLKAKVDWTKVIKKLILTGLGKNVISTWKKASRKHNLLPGIKQLARPKSHLAIDTSLSTYPILGQFLGEVYSILKNQDKGVVYPWDAQAYEPIELKKAIDLGYAIKEKKIKGGGGTMIAPVLKVILKSMKHGDIVVVITDGQIFDLKEKTTQELLQKIAQKSGQVIFGSVDVNITIPPRWRKVKIEV